MQFWQSVSSIEADQALSVAQRAEALGFTGVAVGDHLVTPATVESAYPYQAHAQSHAERESSPWGSGASFPEPWQLIVAMATATTQLRFTTSVCIVPIRDVFALAKSVSSAAVLSGERLTLGVGVGWMKEEFDLTGQNFANRGPRTDEMLDIVAALLGGGMTEFHGRFYDFPPVEIAPVPVRRVPVFVGGLSMAALRRAARWDGWLSPPTNLTTLGEVLTSLNRKRREVDDSDKPFEVMACFDHDLDADTCRHAQDLGVTSILVPSFRYRGVARSSLADKQRALESFAKEVIEPCHESA